ncbi:RNA-directed DNA polymerase, eukaryota, reverse transcriptase zinc-binding domain protein [Tanacetum coccineum]
MGMSTSDKQKEVRNFIKEESLQLCTIIKTYINYKKIEKVGENIFGNWEYISNGEDNNKGCRIMVGWNSSKIKVWEIAKSKQCVFLLVETTCQKTKFFCIVVYASNSYIERIKLLRDLGIQKTIANGVPWVILGDFNVTLKVNEHSYKSSIPSNEMIEFQDCIADIEVEDILSSGFQFTWTKSLKNPNYKTLKNLTEF